MLAFEAHLWLFSCCKPCFDLKKFMNSAHSTLKLDIWQTVKDGHKNRHDNRQVGKTKRNLNEAKGKMVTFSLDMGVLWKERSQKC